MHATCFSTKYKMDEMETIFLSKYFVTTFDGGQEQNVEYFHNNFITFVRLIPGLN